MAPVSIDSILAMYNTWGNETYDEDITQLAHALQCAALAHHERSSEELIAAALLHDIGHLFEIERNNGPDYTTNLRHELTGSDYLSELFPPAVTAPIAMHVEAKRYLAANEAGYFDGLSNFLDHTVTEAFVKPVHRQMMSFHSTPDALLDALMAYEPPAAEKWIERFDL